MTVADSIKAQLDDAADIIRRQMARIADLEAEVERLKAGLGAKEYLQSVWRNPASPEGNRIKAAQAVLPHESAPLKPEPRPLDFEEVIIPLAELVEKQRARADKMLSEPPFSDLPKAIPLRRHGNGSNGDDHS
jgi:hypothetical protein